MLRQETLIKTSGTHSKEDINIGGVLLRRRAPAREGGDMSGEARDENKFYY